MFAVLDLQHKAADRVLVPEAIEILEGHRGYRSLQVGFLERLAYGFPIEGLCPTQGISRHHQRKVALCFIEGGRLASGFCQARSEEHTSELQSRENLVC